ncbi:hypothetical protein ACSTIA_23490, partial [Vibrio parahaemolyticus]
IQTITFGTAAGNFNVTSNVSDPGNQALQNEANVPSQGKISVTNEMAAVVLNSLNFSSTNNANGALLTFDVQTLSSNLASGINVSGLG